MNPQTTRLYVVVRKELGDRTFVAHFGHAAAEAGFVPGAIEPSEDESIVVLRATKAQLKNLIENLLKANVPFKACQEIHGPMAGTNPSVGFRILESNRSTVDPLVSHLKTWDPPAATKAEEEQ